MGTPDGKRTRFGFGRSNRAAGIGFTALLVPLLVYLLLAPDTFRELRDGFYLGIIPLLTVAGMLACSVIIVFDRRSAEAFHTPVYEQRPTWRRLALAVGALVSMYVYYQLVLAVGFPVSTLAYVAGLMFVMGIRRVSVMAGAAVFITAFVLAAFALLGFDLPLLPGIFN